MATAILRAMVDGKSESRWYVRVGDHVEGPHPRARILAWHAEGRLPDDALLSPDGQRWHRVRWPKPTARRPA